MIAYAEQRGQSVYVYNERGSNIWINSGELQSFTASTVVIRKGGMTYVYGERGEVKFIR